MKLRTISATCTALLCVALLGMASPATADTLTTFTLNGLTFSDGGTATGSITIDYPTSGTATIASFSITLNDTQLAPPSFNGQGGYGSPTVTMSPSTPGQSWSSSIDGPYSPSGIEPLTTWEISVWGYPSTIGGGTTVGTLKCHSPL